MVRGGVSARSEFSKIGHFRTFSDIERGRCERRRGEPQRHRDTERKRKVELDFLLLFSVPWCLCGASSSPRKTGGVMRFFDHGGAADFYKRGIPPGIWSKIVLDWSSEEVGFLVKSAQRAGG